MRTRLLLLTTISALLLTACGVRGSLKTPPPIWGDKDRAPIENPEGETEAPAPDEDDDLDDYFPE